MRRRISLFVFALLAALVVLGASRLWRQLRQVLPTEALSDRQLTDYDRAYAYGLTSDWLEFELPPRCQHLRVLVNGLAPESLAHDSQRLFGFALEYRLRGGDGVLREGRHALTAGHTRYRQGEREVAALVAPELGGPILDGRVLRTDAGDTKPTHASLRLVSAPELRGVLVRIYAEHGRESVTGELDQRIGLLRLNAAERERLAEASVYPFELLPESERLLLVGRNETPLTPVGIAGEDFSVTRLLLRRDLQPLPEPAVRSPEGRLISAAHRGVFSLPLETNWVFDLRPWPAGSNAAPVRIDWHGRDFVERDSERLVVPPTGLRWTNWFAPGVVEIRSPISLDVTLAEAERPASEAEHTPAPMAFAALISTGAAPSWAIEHLPGFATPVRVDLRRPLWAPTNHATVAAQIEFRDKDGVTLQRHPVAVSNLFTPYDWADLGTNPAAPVSRKQSLSFVAPPAAGSLSVIAEEPTLVNVYTRPGDIFHTLSVPGDFSEPLNSVEREPQWFAIEPGPTGTNSTTPRVKLSLQRRPPPERPELWSGSYRWQDLHPTGDWVARPLLAPRNPAEPFRDEALGSTFTPLAPGDSRRVEFAHPDELRVLRPTLLYLLPEARPTQVTLQLDGAEFWTGKVATKQGEVTLPSLPVGVHEIRLIANGPGTFMINHLRPGKLAFTRRSAIRLTTNRFRILFPKPFAERAVLSARLFVPENAVAERRVRTRLHIPRPASITAMPAWTLDRREYLIRPNPAAASRVLLSHGEIVDGGRSFFIPFGSELPAGEYAIDFEAPDFAGCYLALSTLTPGEHAERVIRKVPVSSAAPSLEQLFRESRRGKAVSRVQIEDERAAQRLFAAAFAGRKADELIRLATPLGMTATNAIVAGETVTILHESPGQEAGRGFYVFRAQGRPLVLQSPHRFFDRHTGEITLRMFMEGRCRAAAWNTVHRWPTGDRKDASSDLARQQTGWWAAFTRAFAEALPEGHCVQVHGYAKSKRITASGKSADLILSAGVLEPPANVRAAFNRVRSALPVPCKLHPVDVGELGGTRNAQGRLLRELGHSGFIHLEMSAELRRQLSADAEQLRRLINSLLP